MGRPLRRNQAGEDYHLFSRAARRRPIFHDDFDRRLFVRVLAYVLSRMEVRLLAYCLMGNHFHLLVRCVEAQLSEFMRDFTSIYVREFNLRHEFDGPMFRDRFQSRHVDSPAYRRNVAIYIHRNPKDIGWSEDLAGYRWSSHRWYTDPQRAPWWVAPQDVLDDFGGATSYEEAFSAGLGFQLESDASALEIREAFDRWVLTGLLESIAELTGVDVEQLRSPQASQLTGERRMAMILARELTDLPYADLAAHFGYADQTGFCRAVKRSSAMIGASSELADLRLSARRRLLE